MTFFPDLLNFNFTQFVFFVVATIGMTHILVDSTIFLPVREFFANKKNDCSESDFLKCHFFTTHVGYWLVRRYRTTTALFNVFCNFVSNVLECYQCCGTWVGFFVAFWLLSYHPMIIFLGGCTGSFSAYFAAVILTYFESQSIIVKGQ